MVQGVVLGREFSKPRAATIAEIARLIDSFAHAAEYLERAGFDGIQYHGAHGYLIAQFLSLTTNKRTDKYGGSLEGRMRLIVEMAAECRKRVHSSFILGIKINSVEFQENGFTPLEAQALCQTLEESRFDFVELSGGTYELFAFDHKRESTKRRESFFIEFAEEIVQPLTRTKSYVTGGLKTVRAMVDALKTVDGIGLSRPICQEFQLPRDILTGKISGATKLALDDYDYVLSATAAGVQIRQVGKGVRPIDLSDQVAVHALIEDMRTWTEMLSNDADRKLYGYPDLSSGSLH